MAARQEVLNVHLASLLSRLGLPTQAERRRRYVPDLMIAHHHLGIVLGEAEIGDSWNDDNARKKLEKRVNERFKQPHFAYIDFIALIIYPKEFLSKIIGKTEDIVEYELMGAKIGFGLAYRQYANEAVFKIRWYHAPVNVTQIPNLIEEMAKDLIGITPELITENLLEVIDKAGVSLSYMKDIKEFLLKKASDLDIEPEIFRTEEDCLLLTTKTMFTLGSIALMIYELARIRYPLQLQDLSPLNVSKFLMGLRQLKIINYVEIIDSAIMAWSGMPSHPQIDQFLNAIYIHVKRGISAIRRGGWDVLAFIYQRLLSETYRKSYATFYTKLPAAYLLANLAINSESDKVIDPACGTGSLLVSAFYVKKRNALKPSLCAQFMKDRIEEPLLDYVNKNLLNDVYGIDALRMAVSLSSGTLTIASLAIPRGRLKLFHAPVGAKRAGSLDLLRLSIIKSNEYKITLKTKTDEPCERVEEAFDVVIMNPPFTRSDRIPTLIGDFARTDLMKRDLSFGGVKLTKLFVAGLAKPFLILADRLCKEGGRIAAVLPNSLLSREAWSDVRKGISNSYMIEYIVISFAPGVPNFSSDTQFREILLVLRKNAKAGKTKIINLFSQIDKLKLHEIDALVYGIKAGKKLIILNERQPSIVATVREFDWPILQKLRDNWYRFIAFKNLDLTEHHLSIVSNCCVPLGKYFTLGSVVDHRDGLDVLSRKPKGTYYKAIWGSGEKAEIKMLKDDSHHFLIIINKDKVKCKIWKEEYSSNLMMLRRGQLDTQYLLMFSLNAPAVSNVWWPLKPVDGIRKEHILALLAFINSTLGIIHILGERLETRGLYMELKKGQLKAMPILDVKRVGLRKLRSIFRKEGFSTILTQPLPKIKDYIDRMAELEKKFGNYEMALENALKDNELRPRAILDRVSIELLKHLGWSGSIPQKLYQLVSDEIQTLREIMEKHDEVSMVKDKGRELLRQLTDKSQKRLDEWSSPNVK